jgi:hypothetical protein
VPMMLTCAMTVLLSGDDSLSLQLTVSIRNLLLQPFP